MSVLTVTLRALALMSTIFGCNIYRFRPRSCKFQRRNGLQSLITLMHYLWLSPWIILTGILYLPWFLMRLLTFISQNTEDDRALVVMYFSSALLCKYQNLIATLLIWYIYKYRLKCVNGFSAIYKRYWRLYGCAPRINWWLFGVYVFELLMVGGSVIKRNSFSRIPYIVPHSPIDKYLSWSSVFFVALQPFLLGLLAHLGLLLLHAYYEKELQFMQQQKHRSNIIAKEQVQHYVNLFHLRHHFEVLLRPFVWVALSQQINDCMISLHLLLYDHHRLCFLLYSLCVALIYPMCFVYQTIFIKSAEKQLGNELLRFKNNGSKQQQLQMFCLYKQVLCYVWTDSSFDIFNLNRSHILECMTYSWIWAMFTNSLLVNSPKAWQQHYEYIKQQTHY